jgi:hypothetical protein
LAPDGGITTTIYSGNETTVTDPAGKWKKRIRQTNHTLDQTTSPVIALTLHR